MKFTNKRLQKIEITWIDSIADRRQLWQYFNDYLNEWEDETFITIGYLVKKTKKHIHVCQSLHGVDGKYERGAEFFSIPIGCVKSIKNIK